MERRRRRRRRRRKNTERSEKGEREQVTILYQIGYELKSISRSSNDRELR